MSEDDNDCSSAGKKVPVTEVGIGSTTTRQVEQALIWIQGLYAIERTAREQKLDPAERKELRLEKSLPIINELGKWIHAGVKNGASQKPDR